MKKKFAVLLVFIATMHGLEAQSYPYWDAAEPGLANGNVWPWPIVATTNAVFTWGFGGVARWTECGGWESLPGIDVLLSPSCNHIGGQVNSMTIHDHYLYAVGIFTLVGYTNAMNNSDLVSNSLVNIRGLYPSNAVQIARFDLNTGVWSPIGQNFSAHDAYNPTTIAIDSSNHIYVGFDLYGYGDPNDPSWPLPSGTLDMLDVSTNNGASWQIVGSGLQSARSTSYQAGITALVADSTNVYIGGDFTGPTGGSSSSNLVMWAGHSWRALGFGPYVGEYGYEGGDVVRSIAIIGTNIYAAGGYYEAQSSPFLARLSNVTGQSLPTGSPPTLFGIGDSSMGWNACLAVNNGNLYFGGLYTTPNDLAGCLSRLSDPSDANPTGWTTNLSSNPSDSIIVPQTYGVVAAANGNAVYVYNQSIGGQDSFGNSSDGYSRLVTGPEGPNPTAAITNIDWQSSLCSLSITGTPASHWQVIESPDATSWTIVGSVTLWNGTATFVDNTSYSTQPFYQLTNNCSQSAVFPCGDTYTLSVTNDFLRDPYIYIYDNANNLVANFDAPANSVTSYNISVSVGEQFQLDCYDYIGDQWGEPCYFAPTLEFGAVVIDKDLSPVYSESGPPLCPP